MRYIISTLFFLTFFITPIFAQSAGTLRGSVSLDSSGGALHGVTVTIIRLNRKIVTDDNGKYEFLNVPAGKYEVHAHLDRAPDSVQNIEIIAGGEAKIDFQIKLSGVRDQVTITATGNEETTFNSIQSVTTLGAIELAEKNPTSLGEALDHQLGVAKRSEGPGSSRPVIRGFDGDRVVILQDGMRVGGLGAQSGDHAEPIDVMSLDKIEVVKGPATLLYGSSATGGVVNAITGHDSAHNGIHGYLTGVGSSNNYTGGGSGGLEFGTDKWLFWGNGGGLRSGEYKTPLGKVLNSYSRESNGSGGFGYYAGKGFFNTNYTADNRYYGIPYDKAEADPEIVHLDMHRQSVQFKAGLHDLESFFSGAQFKIQYNDYNHKEINSVTNVINTTFINKSLVYSALAEQKKVGRLSGSVGVWGLHRDYKSIGAEALAPPTIQNAFAGYALETINFSRAALQFGGRVEHNGYTPIGKPARSFNGVSAAVGLRVPLWEGGAFVANYSHSYRAPALEELYNNGPHGGNSTFEIGNDKLKRESNDGVDFSLRQQNNRFRGELNYYYYHIRDFVFLAPTGARDATSGLIVANYAQGTSRYTGVEARADVNLNKNFWFQSSLDYVNAQLTASKTPLPRIPPLRGRLGLEGTFGNFRFAPELILSRAQNKIFTTETPTDGYATFGFNASYTFAMQHVAQIISFKAFNLGNKLYYNHLSFIKDFAPEIGRGVQLSYTLRFF